MQTVLPLSKYLLSRDCGSLRTTARATSCLTELTVSRGSHRYKGACSLEKYTPVKKETQGGARILDQPCRPTVFALNTEGLGSSLTAHCEGRECVAQTWPGGAAEDVARVVPLHAYARTHTASVLHLHQSKCEMHRFLSTRDVQVSLPCIYLGEHPVGRSKTHPGFWHCTEEGLVSVTAGLQGGVLGVWGSPNA